MGIGGAITPAVRGLIVANVAVFLIQSLLEFARLEVAASLFVNLFGLRPDLVFSRFYFWQLGTYLFLHGDLGHILINMLMLWMFGAEMERIWGPSRFLRYYFLTGAGAAVLTCIFSPHSRTIGASGAIFGVMLAYGMTFPNREILFWFVFPMKAKYFVLLLGAIELWASSRYLPDGVGHFAHLGGMLFGYLYLRRAWRVREWFAEMRWKARRRRFRVFEREQENDRRYPYH